MEPDDKPLLAALAFLGFAAVIAIASELHELLKGRT
jgi:hypothetical protein